MGVSTVGTSGERAPNARPLPGPIPAELPEVDVDRSPGGDARGGDIGLDSPSVATMVGHDDGSYLIATLTPSSVSDAPSPAPYARWMRTSKVALEERHLRLVADGP